MTAVLFGTRLCVANVGDSRAVLCRAGKGEAAATPGGRSALAGSLVSRLPRTLHHRLRNRVALRTACAAIPISVDHKPNSKEERERIEAAGGVIVWAGTWRVGGVLAVSRAFGDRPLKRFVIATPDVREEQLTPDDELLILASDGLWDVVSNQEAVNLVREVADAEKAAKRLTEEALQRGSNDNISCIIVRFK